VELTCMVHESVCTTHAWCSWCNWPHDVAYLCRAMPWHVDLGQSAQNLPWEEPCTIFDEAPWWRLDPDADRLPYSYLQAARKKNLLHACTAFTDAHQLSRSFAKGLRDVVGDLQPMRAASKQLLRPNAAPYIPFRFSAAATPFVPRSQKVQNPQVSSKR
jgi:hypothetical protein